MAMRPTPEPVALDDVPLLTNDPIEERIRTGEYRLPSLAGRVRPIGGVVEDAAMPRWPADHVKRPEPDHSRADLRVGRVWLAEEAEKYTPAKAILERLTEAEADLARIPVGTLSKHRTHRWTGRHWKEIDG
jgi:hypothetical protein